MQNEIDRQLSLREAAETLLASSEALRESISSDSTPGALVRAFELRAIAFDALQDAVASGAEPDAVARTCLARVRVLDAAMIEAGRAQADATRNQRQELLRRRSAIQAHALREREQPRFVAVKA